MKLVHIDSAITGVASVSRKLTADVVARLRRAHPYAEVSPMRSAKFANR
jgi:FMN-dependent NADH-azoreductase